MSNYEDIAEIRLTRLAAQRLRTAKISPQASFVVKRLEKASVNDLPAVTGIQRSVLAGYLEELERAGIVELVRRPPAIAASAVVSESPQVAQANAVAAPPQAQAQPVEQPRAAAKPPAPVAKQSPPLSMSLRLDLSRITRVLPSTTALALRREDLSPIAAKILAELDGPLTPQDLLLVTGLNANDLALALAELVACESIYVIQEDQPEAVISSTSPKAAPPRRRLRPVSEVFAGDPFASASTLPSALILHRLYEAMRAQDTLTLLWCYGDQQVWALRLQDGYPSVYKTNRDEDAWKIGKLLQQVVGLGNEALAEALRVQGAASGKIGDLLIERGYLRPEQLTRALALQKQTGRLLGDILVQEKFLPTEVLSDVLTLQRRSRMRIGELLVDLEYLTPKDIQQALIMQMRWVLRELLLQGPPTRAATLAAWPFGPEEPPKRFAMADWLLKTARRQREQVLKAGWWQAWRQQGPWVNRPAPSQNIQRNDLSIDERKVFDRYSNLRGTALPELAGHELILIAAGLLEPVPVVANPSVLPAWTAAHEPFQFFGLHWSALPSEIERAAAERQAELSALASVCPASELAALQKKITTWRSELLDEEKYRARLLAAQSATDRENAAELLIERGMNSLHLRADLATAEEVAQRLLRICWNVPAPLAAASYIAWGVALQRGKSADARRHRERLENLVANHSNQAEVQYYFALLLSLEGDRRGATRHARAALMLNPYLKDAKKLLE